MVVRVPSVADAAYQVCFPGLVKAPTKTLGDTSAPV